MAAPTPPSAGAVTDTGGSGRSAAGGTGVLIGRSFRTVLREWDSGSADGGSGQRGRIGTAGRGRRGCGGRARPVAGKRGGQDVRGERAQHRPGGGAGALAVGAAAVGGQPG